VYSRFSGTQGLFRTLHLQIRFMQGIIRAPAHAKSGSTSRGSAALRTARRSACMESLRVSMGPSAQPSYWRLSGVARPADRDDKAEREGRCSPCVIFLAPTQVIVPQRPSRPIAPARTSPVKKAVANKTAAEKIVRKPARLCTARSSQPGDRRPAGPRRVDLLYADDQRALAASSLHSALVGTYDALVACPRTYYD
jgi:hypothetical protein